MTVVLVTGGRKYRDLKRVFQVFDRIHQLTPITLIIHGDARGADQMAGQWAESVGIPCDPHPADWDKHPRAAGPIRNREMVKLKPDLVVAFPGGVGTQDMVEVALRAGIRVRRFK